MKRLVSSICVLVLSLALFPSTVQAELPASGAFHALWQRTDLPVARGEAQRTWMWGEEARTVPLIESYSDAPGGVRIVQYFDKSRMEISNPQAEQSSPWYVSNGLLTRELITGRLQMGDTNFNDTGQPAWIPVAGDPENAYPTYADLRDWIDRSAPDRTGQPVTTARQQDGDGDYAPAASDPNALAAHYERYAGPGGQTGYNIPRAFWDFMTQGGLIFEGGTTRQAQPLFDWLFVLGYPIGEPFWSQLVVAGAPAWVMIQPFERRVLTYTPSNPVGWQVEMGNIGQHYYHWRYDLLRTTTDPTTVIVADYYFKPGTLTVSRGTTVAWQVVGDRAHRIVADNGSWQSGDLARGQVFSQRFERPGTYRYHCFYYVWMTGTIVVQ